MRYSQRGSALLLVIIVIATLFGVLGLSLERSSTALTNIQQHNLETVALNLAEAGVEYAIHQLLYAENREEGEMNMRLETGAFTTTVSRLTSSGLFEITSTGTVEGSGNDVMVKTLKTVIQFSPEDPEQPLLIHSREEVF